MRFPAPMRLRVAVIVSVAVCFLAGPAFAEEYPIAVFSGLDKTTARVTAFTARVGEPARFGSLDVLVRACDKKPPEEPPQTAAYVEIRQIDRTVADGAEGSAGNAPAGETVEAAPVFKGWMFAESPGLNALEHPVYDIWVTDCSTSPGETSSGKT